MPSLFHKRFEFSKKNFFNPIDFILYWAKEDFKLDFKNLMAENRRQVFQSPLSKAATAYSSASYLGIDCAYFALHTLNWLAGAIVSLIATALMPLVALVYLGIGTVKAFQHKHNAFNDTKDAALLLAFMPLITLVQTIVAALTPLIVFGVILTNLGATALAPCLSEKVGNRSPGVSKDCGF